MYYVIGSGPAGVACAQALLDRDLPVHMVDAGYTMEEEARVWVHALARKPPAQWTAAELSRVKGSDDVNREGIVLKRSFGSDFPYRGVAEHIGIEPADAALKPSLALGGLSNVWGAAMLPYAAGDFDGWPLRLTDLAPHYAAALRLTGFAAGRDALEKTFPRYAENAASLRMSRQALRLWQHLQSNETLLRRDGIAFGSSRLAVSDCVYCGLCMYGCPYGYIYNSAATIERMKSRAHFTYESGVIVTRVEETGGTVVIHGYHAQTREPWKAHADRVFLAAGVLPTTKILLASKEAYDQPRWIRDSQYFLFPMAQWKRTPGVREEAAYTLSQIFLEITDPRLSAHTIHVQVYSYNDIVSQVLRATLGPLGRDWIVRQLEDRILIAQAYLHSDLSSQIRIALEKTPRGSRLHLETETNPGSAATIRRVVRKLVRQSVRLRATPLEPLLRIAPAGRGFHSGGTFPMRREPGHFETDPFGRLPGWERIHAVDSTIFPTIPATTITLSVMANAHRIAATVSA